MKKNIFLLTFLFTFVLTAAAQPVLPITKAIPADAQWVLHWDMKTFVSTQVGNWFAGDETSKLSRFTRMIQEKFKIDFFRDLTGITYAGMEKGNHGTVVFWQGKMDKDLLIGLAASEPDYHKIPYGKYTIQSWRGPQFGVFANDRLLLRSNSETALKHVLDVIDGKKKNMTDSGLMAYWREIPGEAFLKAVAHNLSSLVHKRETSMILKKTGIALFLALEKNEDLKLALKLNTDSPETAKNIQQIVMGYMALMKMKLDEYNPKTQQYLKLLENLDINLAGNVIQMQLIHPSKELLEMYLQYSGLKPRL